jgi:peroxiredoxin
VIGIAIGPGDLQQVQRFRKRNKLHYPLIQDRGQFAELFDVEGVPVKILIGRDGIVRSITVGSDKKEFAELQSRFRTLVRE